MPASMAPKTHLALLLLVPLLTIRFVITSAASGMFSFACSELNKTCTSLLYQHNGLQTEQVAVYYSVNASEINPFDGGNQHDYLVKVPCSCSKVNTTAGFIVDYFYTGCYKVQEGDTFANVSSQIYSGQAWEVGGEDGFYNARITVPVHLLCGCVEESEPGVTVTYAVQQNDTLSDIATLLSADISEIQRYNQLLIRNPELIVVGWLLFVPMEKTRLQSPKTRE